MKFVLDSHSHTIASGHAYSTLFENAKAAYDAGLELLAITDHAPTMPNSTKEIYFQNFRVIPEVINDVKILMGVEVNILDKAGNVDLPDYLLKSMKPVIASFHPKTNTYSSQDMDENEKRNEVMTALCNIMENPLIHIIGHPGDPRFPLDVEMLVSKSMETKTLLEINNSNLSKKAFRVGSREYMCKMLNECKKRGCKVIVGTDAHIASAIGKFDFTYDLFKELDFPEDLILNNNVEEFLNALNNKRCNNEG